MDLIKNFALGSIVVSLHSLPAHAAFEELIGYGSRAGMEVTVVSKESLDSEKATIRTRHTRENAIAFCRDYVQNVTEDCIQAELSTKLTDVIKADCWKGIFTDFYGTQWRFLGPNPRAGQSPKYYLVNTSMNNQLADGSMASGYPIAMDIFKALCPLLAPSDS